MTGFKLIPLAAVAVLIAACTWVPVSQQGADVQVFPPNEVGKCERKGKVTVSVKHKIAGAHRSGEKVSLELITLARNAAAKMGGNMVSPETDPNEGSQVFGVYVCPGS